MVVPVPHVSTNYLVTVVRISFRGDRERADEKGRMGRVRGTVYMCVLS